MRWCIVGGVLANARLGPYMEVLCALLCPAREEHRASGSSRGHGGGGF